MSTHHSEEAAVLKILINILLVIEECDLAALAFYNISTAFDSLGNEILLQGIVHHLLHQRTSNG